MTSLTIPYYSIDLLRDEAKGLIQSGSLHRQQPIYALYQYIPPREWSSLEWELECHNFLPRDRLADFVGREDWDND